MLSARHVDGIKFRIWAIIKRPPIAVDTAYLLGRCISRHESVLASSVLDPNDCPAPPEQDFDCVFNRSLSTDADFLMQLEKMAISRGSWMINSAAATLRAVDKRTYLQDFSEFIPESRIVNSLEEFLDLREDLGVDLVIKYPFGSFGREVARYLSKSDLADVIRVFSVDRDCSFVAQKYCPGFVEGDKRVIMHRSGSDGFEISAWFSRVPARGDWIANISRGGSVRQCVLQNDEVELCHRVARIADLDYIGVDIGRDENRCYLIETNAYPGGHVDFDGFSSSNRSGDDFARMITAVLSR